MTDYMSLTDESFYVLHPFHIFSNRRHQIILLPVPVSWCSLPEISCKVQLRLWCLQLSTIKKEDRREPNTIPAKEVKQKKQTTKPLFVTKFDHYTLK